MESRLIYLLDYGKKSKAKAELYSYFGISYGRITVV
jgi:hypothetical protein